MGKAAILLVLATGLAVTYGLVSSIETGQQTAKHQASYEERVIAREIARSGFNVAMGILRQYGDDLQGGVNEIVGDQGYLEGEHQGGFYRATARFVTGHSVEVVSIGYFGGQMDRQGEYRGGATHTMDDSFIFRVTSTPLLVKQCSKLQVRFLSSEAGYCSSVYMQRYLPDVALADQPAPEMIFAPGNWRTSGELTVDKILGGGTQMNFFVGVRQDCNLWGQNWNRNDNWRSYDVENRVFNAADYNHLHYAFESTGGDLAGMEESIWALVEQHPRDNQRWRIAWEDQHNTSWDRPNSRNPQNSLQATKRFGYDGNGWPTTDAIGYRILRDYDTRPDFSDQVIQVQMQEADPALCAGGSSAGGTEPDDEEEGGGSTPVPPVPVDDDDIRHEFTLPDPNHVGSCPCPSGNQNHKVAIMHRPPGNPGNQRVICVANSGARAHLLQHNDYVVCRGN